MRLNLITVHSVTHEATVAINSIEESQNRFPNYFNFLGEIRHNLNGKIKQELIAWRAKASSERLTNIQTVVQMYFYIKERWITTCIP